MRLKELEAEANILEENHAEFGTKWESLRLAQSPLPLEGAKVCTLALEKIRSYESEWSRAFCQGHEPDAVCVPALIKDDTVRTIRQCSNKAIRKRTLLFCLASRKFWTTIYDLLC